MKMMHKSVLAAILLAIAIPALAGNNNGPDNGGGDSSATANGGNSYAGGGSANAGAIAGAAAGAISGSHSSVGDVTNVAAGGRGGDGGSALSISEGGKGGDAQQGQGQSQSNRSETNTSTQQNQTSQSFNAGNAQNVGGQSTNIKFEDVANAPPVFLGNIAATVSCAGGVNAGASSQGGSGAFGFTWISADCKQTVAGQNMAAIGEKRMACEIFRQTDGFKRAAKRNPAINEITCK